MAVIADRNPYPQRGRGVRAAQAPDPDIPVDWMLSVEPPATVFKSRLVAELSSDALLLDEIIRRG